MKTALISNGLQFVNLTVTRNVGNSVRKFA